MIREPDDRLPRVLVITRNLPPLLGGMERLNLNLVRELSKSYRVTVVGPEGCGTHLPNCVRAIEVPLRPLGRFLWRALLAAWKAAAAKPLLVVAGSGLTAPMARLASWRARGRAIAYVHGLDLVARHPVYRILWVPFLRALDHAWANSASTADIAARLGVAQRRISVLHPGVSLPGGDPQPTGRFRAEHGLSDFRIMLSVGRLTARKGLVEFIRNALPAIRARHPDSVLLVIGEEAANALDVRGGEGKAAIFRAAADAGMEDAVRVLPHCSDSALADAYRAADVHVFPVVPVDGDIEGFGMVALEAAAHGLPTVAFAVGGVPDAVAHGISGRLVVPGDYRAFAEHVADVLDGGDDGLCKRAIEFAAGFEWARFGEKLRTGLHSLVDGTPARAASAEGHAVLDLPSRVLKARKIEALLGLVPGEKPLRILEIGSGSGGIAHYFATHRSLTCEVEAVDVSDSRQLFEGYRFRLVDGVRLPFDASSFDIVISNHVIEHVGSEAEQARHIAEMRRVLAPGGRGYLAVPNRWMLREPHYRLAFLSWLPRAWRSPYLMWRRGVAVYDCEPLAAGVVERLFIEAGLSYERAIGAALKKTIELERAGNPLLQRVGELLPVAAVDRLAAIMPTLVYRFGHPGNEDGARLG